jgi:hypothetical protein
LDNRIAAQQVAVFCNAALGHQNDLICLPRQAISFITGKERNGGAFSLALATRCVREANKLVFDIDDLASTNLMATDN